jgi:plasmid replication initiation protein
VEHNVLHKLNNIQHKVFNILLPKIKKTDGEIETSLKILEITSFDWYNFSEKQEIEKTSFFEKAKIIKNRIIKTKQK